MPLVSRTFDQLISFTRTSAATYVNSAGNIVTTPASKNLLTFTEEFDTGTVWGDTLSGTGVTPTLTANVAAAPDGSMTADRIQFSLGGGTTTTDLTRRRQIYSTADGTYTFSIYLRSFDGSSTYNMHLVGSDGATNNIVVTGTWQRFTLTATRTGGTASISYSVGLRGGQTPANSNTADILAWGAQLETGSTATSYVRNFGGLFPPRFDYDPVTLQPRGLLIEEQRTNLLLRSEEFDNASWVKSRATVTANATISPDGTADADKLVEDTTATATHRTYQQAAKAASSLTRTFSVFLKAAERSFARVGVSDNFESVTARTDVDLSAGTVTTASIGGGSTISAASSSISPAGNGWYRVSITTTFDATITNPGAFVFISTAIGGITYTGDGASGIFVWGAQWEDGSFATSYIQTVASQVTRTADQASIVAPNFAPWYNQSEGTFVVEADTTVAVSTNVYRSMTVSDGTAANYMGTFQYNTNWGSVGVVGSVTQFDRQPSGSYTSGVPAKVAMAYKANDFAVSVGGSAPLTDNAGAVPAASQMNIGSILGSGHLNGHIRRISYYPSRLSNAQLQALSA